MTIEETRQERHKLVAEALKQKAEKEAPSKPQPVPDTIIKEPEKAASKKAKEMPPQKAKKKAPVKKEG